LEDYRLYWIGLNLVKGIGSVRFKLLLDHFGDAKRVWNAHADELRSVDVLPSVIDNLIEVRSTVSLEKVWDKIQNLEVTVLTWEDNNYPTLLRELSQSPPVLYIRGKILPQDDWAVAVVGTRRITHYGRQVTERIATKLAHAGVTLVSGLARGVDGVAHKIALESGGRTLAVLGCGVDIVYPPEHRSLSEKIIQQGAVISDYPLGTPPESSNFPPRNRIISGLSRATVIVEAGKRSGALITAGFAADQGREVFAVPGSVLAPQSRGTNRLIQDGARMLTDSQEILESLDMTRIVEQKDARIILPANETETHLFNLLSHEPLHVDEIRNETNYNIELVTSTLALMELKGMVRQVGGMRYAAIKDGKVDYIVESMEDGV
jgi:DNA processing protein